MLANVPPTMLALGGFVVLLLAPLDDVVETGALLAARILSGLTFVSISALGIWASINFVQPSCRVALRARALADGDLASPVPHRGRDDEIDWIADSILATASAMRELEASRHMLRELNRTLEDRVAERTAALIASNRRLEQALADISAVQRELVRHERLASLGSMVAGFAHELNTPIGNALTSASVLAREVRTLKAANVSDPATVADRLQRVSELLERSLGRAAELITTFKQVSVDQASAQRRSFQLHDAVRALHDTVSPRLCRTPVRLRLAVPIDIHLSAIRGRWNRRSTTSSTTPSSTPSRAGRPERSRSGPNRRGRPSASRSRTTAPAFRPRHSPSSSIPSSRRRWAGAAAGSACTWSTRPSRHCSVAG
jgi:signal transduction histidine kinase